MAVRMRHALKEIRLHLSPARFADYMRDGDIEVPLGVMALLQSLTVPRVTAVEDAALNGDDVRIEPIDEFGKIHIVVVQRGGEWGFETT